MMTCEEMEGEDLHLIAMESSTGADGDGTYIFASAQMASEDQSTAERHTHWIGEQKQQDDVLTTMQIVSEEKSRVGRRPRWTRDESLILIEGKRLEEAKWSKVKEDRERGIETGRANSDSKWLSVSQFCERMGVSRSAAQCRKRWCNLSADYKRIRDWETLRGKQSFWLMSNDVRKDNKLPGCFDREVYDALSKSLGAHACSAPETIFDSGRQGTEDGLFSDIEHPLVEENLSVSADKEIDSPAMESLTSAHAHYEEKSLCEKFNMEGCEDAFDEETDLLPGRKKRKRPAPLGVSDDLNRKLCSLLESTGKILTAHMDAQNLNSHLDRTQRKEHADGLVLVLGKLVDAVGKIAEKL